MKALIISSEKHKRDVPDFPAALRRSFRQARREPLTPSGAVCAKGVLMPKSVDTASAANPPDTADLRKLRAAAADCTACPLYKNATQTVFGEGPRRAEAV